MDFCVVIWSLLAQLTISDSTDGSASALGVSGITVFSADECVGEGLNFLGVSGITSGTFVSSTKERSATENEYNVRL